VLYEAEDDREGKYGDYAADDESLQRSCVDLAFGVVQVETVESIDKGDQQLDNDISGVGEGRVEGSDYDDEQ
jgi:hypothetical protein